MSVPWEQKEHERMLNTVLPMLVWTICISGMQEFRGRGEGWSIQGGIQGKGCSSHITPTKQDELAKQLKYQQHQIDALVGQRENLVSLVRAVQPSLSVARTGNSSYGGGVMGKRPKVQGRGLLGKGPALSAKSHSPANS